MKLASILTIIAVNALAVTAQQGVCPNDWYSGQIMITSDTIVSASALSGIADPNGTFFTIDLMYTAEELEAETERAMDYFNTRFGLNYSSSGPDENSVRYFGNTTFRNFKTPYTPSAWSNRWLPSGSTRSKCYDTTQGGFIVQFSAPQLLHGTYGGVEGRVASVNMIYAFYRIDACPTSPIVIQQRTYTPSVLTPEGIFVDNNIVFNRVLGSGIEQGFFYLAPLASDPSMNRVVAHHHILIPSETVP